MDVEVEHPHVHHHRTGHRWLDLALPVAALFVSFVSIFIAWHHGQVMRELVHQNERLVQANSLPWLQLYGSNRISNGLQDVSFQVANQGVGPGEIRSVQILVDGRPVPDLRALLDACCGKLDFEGLGTSTLLGRMIRPGEEYAYILMPAQARTQAAVRALNVARQSDRIETRICYCSVFGDCWTQNSRTSQSPKAVEQCPMPQPQYRE
ncbi:MAG: hypothetical protein ACJ8D5_00240 [Sphingomicrobium sp.]